MVVDPRLARLYIDDLLEPVLMLVALFAHPRQGRRHNLAACV
jgi:hypothetical protein